MRSCQRKFISLFRLFRVGWRIIYSQDLAANWSSTKNLIAAFEHNILFISYASTLEALNTLKEILILLVLFIIFFSFCYYWTPKQLKQNRKKKCCAKIALVKIYITLFRLLIFNSFLLGLLFFFTFIFILCFFSRRGVSNSNLFINLIRAIFHFFACSAKKCKKFINGYLIEWSVNGWSF